MRIFLITAFALLCFGGTAQAWPWDHNTNVTCYGGDGKVSMRVSNGYPTTVNCSERTKKRTNATRPSKAMDVVAKPAPHPRGKPYLAFCPGGATPEEIARRVEEAYRRNPDAGLVKLRGCHADTVQMMAAFKKGDATATFTDWKSFVLYLRNDLELTTVSPDTLFYSSCLKGKGSGADDVKMECQKEYIPKGAPVYANKHTHQPVLIKKCFNPGMSLVQPAAPPPCDLIIAPAAEGDVESHNPIYGPAESPTCHGYEWVTLEGDTIRVLENGGELAPGCPENDVCNYRGADEMAAPLERTFAGVAKLHPGLVAYRVDHRFSTNPGNLFGVCILHVDPETGEWYTSQTALVRPEDYRTMRNGQRVAIIFYSSTMMTKAGHVENDPGGLYLWKK